MTGTFLPTFTFLLALLVTCQEAQAFELHIGGGLAFTQMSISSDLAGGQKSIYNGPGFLGEARLRTNLLGPHIPIDFFGSYSQMKTNNTNSAAKESNASTAFGAGVDVHLWRLFLGAQGQVASAAITAAKLTTTLAYRSLGARAGINLVLGDTFTLSLGGIAETAHADLLIGNLNVSSTILEYSGFAVLQIRLFRTSGPKRPI